MFARTRRARGLTFLTAASLAFTLGACSSSDSPEAAPGNASEMTIFNGASGQIAVNFNPFAPAALQPTFGIIYEPLFFFNTTKVADPEPWLGKSFSWNEDNTVLTVILQDGVTWSDGEEFSADDVAFTFNLIRETPALNTSGFDAAVEATDASTVVFTFPESAVFDAPSVLGRTYILPEHIWKEQADPSNFVNEKPVGTGTYALDKFTAQFYTLERNENYYGEVKPEVQTLRYISLAGNTNATDSFLAGEIDWMSAFIPEIDTVLTDKENTAWINTPQNQAALFTCSDAALGCVGPQTDPAIRQAIYYGIDRNQLNALAFSGMNADISPTWGLLGRDEEWISDEVTEKVAPSTADAAKSAQILEAAGWVKGSDGIYAKDGERASLSIQVVTGWTDFISAVDAMGQQLKAAGIEVTSQQVSWQEWTDAKTQGTYQLSMDSIGQGAGADLYFVYNDFFSTANTAKVGEKAPKNVARYSNPTVDQAILDLRETADPAAQAALYATIQKELVVDMPYIPILTNSTLTEFRTDKVEGWPTQDDLYAFPATWANPDAAQVLMRLTPVQ